jgi:hypothetical protein
VSFFHLSWHRPDKFLNKPANNIIDARWHDLRYSDVLNALQDHSGKARSQNLSTMLRDFLEDMGVDVYREIDLAKYRNALTFLVLQVCGFNHRSTGLGKLYNRSNSEAGPELLRLLMGNVSEIAEWLREHNRKLATRSPVTRFGPRRWYATPKVAKALKATKDESLELHPSTLSSGSVYIDSQVSLKTGTSQWAYMSVGFYVEVDPEVNKKAIVSCYASVFFLGEDAFYEASSGPLDEFPTEAQARKAFGNLLRSAANEAKRNKRCPEAVKDLVVPTLK